MSNIVLWVLVGGAAGWIGYALLKFNRHWGLLISVLIGMVGGFLGGSLIAPMLGGAGANPGDFNPFPLFVAFASALVCVIVSNMLHSRPGST
jgi:uncharacterized membrane protein YeaQ/YmgE (transglycosylase-associated protein family)